MEKKASHGLILLLLRMFHVVCLHELKIGALIEKPTNESFGMMLHAAVDLAVKKVNNDASILNNYKLKYVIGNSGCNGKDSIGELARLVYKEKIEAVIGPSCNEGCLSGGYLATYHNMAMISHKCSTSKMSDRTKYPTFGRVRAYASASVAATAKGLAHFFKSMKWSRIGIIHSNDIAWSAVTDSIRPLLQKLQISVGFDKDYIKGHETSSANASVLALKSSSVRIVCVLAGGEDILNIATSARQNGLFDGRYVFISLDLYTWESAEWKPGWLAKYPSDSLTGWFDVSSRSLTTSGNAEWQQEYDEFSKKVQQRLLLQPFYVQVAKIRHSAFYIHDAIIAYAKLLSHAVKVKYNELVISHIYSYLQNKTELLSSLNMTNITKNEISIGIWPGNHSNYTFLRNLTLPMINFTFINSTFNTSALLRDGSYLAKQMHALDFNSVSGRLKFDALGNREPNLVIRNFKNIENVITIARYDSIKQIYNSVSTSFTFANKSTIIPPDRETCGFMNDRCPVSKAPNTQTLLLAIFLPICSVVALAIAYHLYKKRKFENDIFNNKRSFLHSADMIVQREDFETLLKESFDDLSSMRNDSTTDKDDVNRKENGLKQKRNASGQLALYKHESVFVKRLEKTSVSLNRDVLLEIKLARDIHHSNVNPYLGVIVEPPKICIVSPYCTKGSLRDVLSNDDISLEWVFRVSFAGDISAGMAEIHEAIGPMGNLTSYNVLVDRRWTCRIADYGMELFKDNPRASKKYFLTEEEKYKKLLWTAPELLSLTVDMKNKQGDVYAYGIILSEIITRLMPYENYGYPSKDLIHFVQRRCLPPFRPHVRLQSGLDGRMLDLMRRCWHEFPAERPVFNDIRKLLRNVMKDRNENQNLVDNMLAMMENHTRHLEKRVGERTEQLTKEKEKVESLLYTMLPKSIAHRLKMGEVIKPETYQNVSILLTDIVDFSSITTTSTPMQVVDLFNDMYHCFDTIIDRFDVFKLENDNEKYVVISGCPKRNGIRHVKNIAMLALKLLAKMTVFKIRHKPGVTLRLRIGCHAGLVVGGVVGIKSPRYCVYGDSMSYIRHLVTTGPPLRVQISPEFKTELNEIGGFQTIVRGPVRVKGRGLIVSHFLIGKEGMDIVLPAPETDKGVELKDLGTKQ